ncbi:hypothetical protein D050_3071 [Vibrio parahaemolyticus VPCR-2009]|nr:hypothetical protein D050_3071 [Vibrio parahaemolyticus VPCR-2009]
MGKSRSKIIKTSDRTELFLLVSLLGCGGEVWRTGVFTRLLNR